MVLHTRWPQPCGCVVWVVVDKHDAIHGATIGQRCALHGAASALYGALRDLVTDPPAPDGPTTERGAALAPTDGVSCAYSRAREALARVVPPPTAE